MKTCKVIIVALTLSLVFAGLALADVVYPSGTVTAVNDIDSFTDVNDLNFNANGNDVTVATITISNNWENAFDLKFEFTNDGVFKRVSAAGGDGTAATGVGAEIPITQFRLAHTGGTLGAGLTAPDGTFTLTSDAGPDYYIWDTHSTQSTATVDYVIDLQCDWSSSTADLQGTYQETVTATLTVGDGL